MLDASRPHLALRTATAVALLLLAACASHRPQPPRDAPRWEREWQTRKERRHPLVGRIYDVRSVRFVDEGALRAAATGADLVLLGETHDNPDHHLIQAELVKWIAASGRRPALAFEMLDTGQQAAVDAALQRSPPTAEAVAEAVTWNKSGWPDFALYQPVFDAGLDGGMAIVAANLPRDQVKALVRTGPEALDAAVRERLEREGPFPEEVRSVLRKEMSESHCGELPAAMLDPLILAQRARDVQMAESLLAADKGQGAVLVAGAGHVRTDWGIGALLARGAPDRKVLSIAIVEAGGGLRMPDDYAKELSVATPPFDYMVFTPRAEREDQCEKLRQHQKRKQHPAEKTAAEQRHEADVRKADANAP